MVMLPAAQRAAASPPRRGAAALAPPPPARMSSDVRPRPLTDMPPPDRRSSPRNYGNTGICGGALEFAPPEMWERDLRTEQLRAMRPLHGTPQDRANDEQRREAAARLAAQAARGQMPSPTEQLVPRPILAEAERQVSPGRSQAIGRWREAAAVAREAAAEDRGLPSGEAVPAVNIFDPEQVTQYLRGVLEPIIHGQRGGGRQDGAPPGIGAAPASVVAAAPPAPALLPPEYGEEARRRLALDPPPPVPPPDTGGGWAGGAADPAYATLPPSAAAAAPPPPLPCGTAGHDAAAPPPAGAAGAGGMNDLNPLVSELLGRLAQLNQHRRREIVSAEQETDVMRREINRLRHQPPPGGGAAAPLPAPYGGPPPTASQLLRRATLSPKRFLPPPPPAGGGGGGWALPPSHGPSAATATGREAEVIARLAAELREAHSLLDEERRRSGPLPAAPPPPARASPRPAAESREVIADHLRRQVPQPPPGVGAPELWELLRALAPPPPGPPSPPPAPDPYGVAV